MAFRSRRLHLHMLSLLPHHLYLPTFSKTTSAQHVASRHIDHTFEKLMRHRKRYLLAFHLARLLLSSPSHSLPLPVLSSLPLPSPFPVSPSYFLRHLPHLFSIHHHHHHPPLVRLTPSASSLSLEESSARSSSPHGPLLLLGLLSMSPSRSLPLRALLKARLPLGLSDDLQTTLDPDLFLLRDNPRERNTHLLSLAPSASPSLVPAVDRWRREAGGAADAGPYGFPQRFPPGMRLTKSYRAKLREWQALPYAGPYEESPPIRSGRRSRGREHQMEKRAVGIAHEFLSLTVEKAVEVEEISHFRKWFGIDLNIRDLFLDHPGIFYLSTKAGRHTVFLREAYDRGRLVEPNPVYVARRKMLELVMLGRRGMPMPDNGDGGEDMLVEAEECESSDVEEEALLR